VGVEIYHSFVHLFDFLVSREEGLRVGLFQAVIDVIELSGVFLDGVYW